MQKTILLADDSPTIRRLVTQTFADADFEIVSVNNGDAAIKTFEEMRPSVVLTDIYMPGKNGYEVCSYIRRHPELNATPVVSPAVHGSSHLHGRSGLPCSTCRADPQVRPHSALSRLNGDCKMASPCRPEAGKL